MTGGGPGAPPPGPPSSARAIRRAVARGLLCAVALGLVALVMAPLVGGGGSLTLALFGLGDALERRAWPPRDDEEAGA